LRGGTVVDEQVFSKKKDVESLEKTIREKIDAIFEQKISDNRFVRSSSESVPTTPDMRRFTEQLKSFRNSLSSQRQELKTLIDQIRSVENLRGVSPGGNENEQLEMVETILQVGREVGPVLDKLLTLTHRMLDDVSAKQKGNCGF
jgi:neutral trehalase